MWHAFDEGKTLGLEGSASGQTIRDEEHAHGARITLEQDTNTAPFAITCGIYGWMVHTRFFSTLEEATDQYDKMKSSLGKIVATLSNSEGEEREKTIDEIDHFVKIYP